MRRFVLFLSWGALAGCFYPAERGRALESSVQALKAQNTELDQKLKEQDARLKDTVPKIDAKIGEVSKALEGLDRAARRSDADTGVQLQKTIEDVAALRGQVETYLHRISELEAALKQVTDETEKRFAAAKGQDAVREAEAKKKVEELRRPDKKEDFLGLADQKAKAGEHAVARALYAEFLKKWPKDELCGEAHFGLGTSYYVEDRCREALPEYGKVIQQFGKTRSAPQAYLHSSECFQKLKMNDEARLALEEVVRQYPKSDSAKAAKVKLQELDKAKKPAPKGKK